MTEHVNWHEDGTSTPEEQTDPPPIAHNATARREALTLLASIFVIAACGLVYELLIATVSSYLLGSSVTQFSVSIGVFIGAMGAGSHLSQRFHRNLLTGFIAIELAIGMLGGLSVLLLFWAYAAGPAYWLCLYALLIAIGTMVGLELPLLTRILKRYGTLRQIIAQALSFDYIGALVGSLLFPLVLLPAFGMARTALLVGLLNVSVAFWNVRVFAAQLPTPLCWTGASGLCGLTLAITCGFAPGLVSLAESRLYEDEIIYTRQTPYQRIVITRWRSDMRLFLDGNLQFASPDEYRYHETLVHPAMALCPRPENVLVLGGGDGLGVREVLKHPAVRQITLVDIDPEMTRLGRTFPALVALNARALHDPRVTRIHEDAYRFLERASAQYDVIIADLPDPNSDVLAKLYSVQFFRLVRRHLSASGVFVTQASSPFFSRDAFWCIVRTLRAAGLQTAPYHAYVPSFGDWGFVLAASRPLHIASLQIRVPTRYLTTQLLPTLFLFGNDTAETEVEVSTLDHPRILQYYLNGASQWDAP
ncbi:MAG: polyamine aminopropyltransferase [Chloroherpetonaceae bacterium]|nr:polyamine aminopropyltransferase [Chthonomonadaceae bacterium]MDW8208860.1 polyamine aminopropyltransferase [Chloroherpetonaceae bacterium]